MALLRIDELREPEREDDDRQRPPLLPAIALDGGVRFIVGRHGTDLNALLPELEPLMHYHLPTRGQWSLHEMLAFLLHRIGPADVWITSWGISHDPLRHVLKLKESGAITSLNCFFDSRVVQECPLAHQLTLVDGIRVSLGKCHGKLLVLQNKEWGITVTTSANLTENPRWENYVISTHQVLATWTRDLIETEMDRGNAFSAL
jgi:hypothetical protein